MIRWLAPGDPVDQGNAFPNFRWASRMIRPGSACVQSLTVCCASTWASMRRFDDGGFHQTSMGRSVKALKITLRHGRACPRAVLGLLRCFGHPDRSAQLLGVPACRLSVEGRPCGASGRYKVIVPARRPVRNWSSSGRNCAGRLAHWRAGPRPPQRCGRRTVALTCRRVAADGAGAD